MESFGTLSMETVGDSLLIRGEDIFHEHAQRIVITKDEGIVLMEWLSRVTA